jgi:hypothetical protein
MVAFLCGQTAKEIVINCEIFPHFTMKTEKMPSRIKRSLCRRIVTAAVASSVMAVLFYCDA